MKTKFTFLQAVLLVMCLGVNAQTVWDDYDNPENVVYTYFDGTAFDQAFANPSATGINTSALCARYVRNGGAQYDVIVIDPAGSNTIDNVSGYVSGAKKMSVKVFSPAPGLTVQITLENSNAAGPTNYPTGRHSFYTATTTQTNAWETLEFAFGQQPDPTVPDTAVNRLVLLFEPGTFNSTVWVFDDLMGPEFINPCAGVTPDNSIIDDFECQRHLSYTFSNGTLANVANPSTGGLNASTSCGKFTKYAPPTSDGAFGGSLNNAFTSTTYNRLKVHLYDPASPQNFHVILQDAANQDLIDTIFTTTGSSAWTEYVMDLSPLAPTASVEKIVFLLNPATTTIDSIFFDNVTLAFDSLVSSVATPLEKSWTRIAPVPFQDYFEVIGEEPIQSVMLHDFTGKLVGMVEQSSGNALRVETSAFPAGVYFATVKGLDGKQSMHKLVKN